MLAPVLSARKVRCRPICDSDLDAVATLLARGFPALTRAQWSAGLARIAALPPVEDLPRFGHALESADGLAGVLLTIPSRRGARLTVNLSSWYVEPGWRTHSTLLVKTATRRRDVTYLNASPAPHTWRILKALGFVPFNHGRSAAFPALAPGRGRVGEEIPAGLPERELMTLHRALGCVTLVCEKDGMLSPFVFKPRRLARPPVKMMELIYCRSTGDFVRCAGPVGRHLLQRGIMGVILDGEVTGMPARYVEGKEPRHYKGGTPPPLNDLAFTEKVIFP